MNRTIRLHRPAEGLDYGGLLRGWVRPWAGAVEAWQDGVRDLFEGSDRHRMKELAECRADPCHCRCCVEDCDLVLEARVGERRIVPIVIENHWRRERPVELQLSSFTPTGQPIAVTGQLLSPAGFVLPPCGEQKVQIQVTISGGGDAATPAPRQGVDVRECAVSYTDLRVIGCDVRPIRLAVAILPQDCGAFAVDCRCGCC
jgi:hypothetical protein